MDKIINTLEIIRNKIDSLMEKINPEEGKEPAEISEGGKYTRRVETFFKPGWTFSFYLGMIALMYIHTKDEKYISYLKRAKKPYTYFLYGNTAEIGHDTGFLYSLYAATMYKLTGEEDYKFLALKAADEVGKRYQFNPRHIQAFYDMRVRGVTDEISLMIVDDMMNMCLLMWAYKETGHSFYRNIYTNHIETAVQYLIRDDYSVRHAYHFDVHSGRPVCEMNYCGYAIGSHWARGTAWMIYGLAKALKSTYISEKYLHPLEGVVRKYLKESEGNAVPVWDFWLKDDKNAETDSSAAAIVASAFADFEDFNLKEDLKEAVKQRCDDTVEALTDKYLGGKDAEYILRYRKGEGCLWGDYFFTELLMKKLYRETLIDFWI